MTLTGRAGARAVPQDVRVMEKFWRDKYDALLIRARRVVDSFDDATEVYQGGGEKRQAMEAVYDHIVALREWVYPPRPQ